MDVKTLVRLKGEGQFRTRIILSILSGKPVRISAIRDEDDEALGLKEYEVTFLRLMEAITNGTMVEINDTGTMVTFYPGVIYGGDVQFDCGLAKSIGYYLEFCIPLAPFSKLPFALSLTGITHDTKDPTCDSLRLVSLAALRKYGITEAELKMKKRGARPGGGGEAYFSCPVVRHLSPIQWTDPGRIKRVRGIAACTRISPQTVNRLVEAAKGPLAEHVPDVLIYTDVHKGSEAGNSPGFSLCLVAESTTGVLLVSEGIGHPGSTPEDLASVSAQALLVKIAGLGCTDPTRQWLYLLLMCLSSEDVSTLQLSTLTPFTMAFLRECKTLLGVTFKLRPHPTDPEVVLATCVGTGYLNYSARTF